jgi:hypothetical protein
MESGSGYWELDLRASRRATATDEATAEDDECEQ